MIMVMNWCISCQSSQVKVEAKCGYDEILAHNDNRDTAETVVDCDAADRCD